MAREARIRLFPQRWLLVRFVHRLFPKHV
jgi:hypothetical protein